jgi:hypothetical protein
MANHLRKLPRCIALGHRTSQVLSQNIPFAWHQGSKPGRLGFGAIFCITKK